MLRILITSLILLSSLSGHAALFGSDCPKAKQSNMPAWVKVGFGYGKEGYRYGFGEARYFDNADYEQLLIQAEQFARQDLVNSIHLVVDASSGISILVETDSGDESVRRNSENRVETHSKLDLPGLPIHRKWQDASSCSVYVQVRIREPMIALVLKRTQANAYLADARNDDKTVKMRLHAIDEAIRLAKAIEFNKIAGGLSSEQMLREFNNVKSDLLRIASRSNHVVYVITQTAGVDTKALEVLRHNMKESISGSFETAASCTSPATCIQDAGRTSANYASIALVKLETSKQNGFWVGEFKVEMTLWDLSNNSRQFSTGEKASRVMNRHKHKLTLKKGLDKWLVQHDDALQQYHYAAQNVGK
jgi:hypothetical protein